MPGALRSAALPQGALARAESNECAGCTGVDDRPCSDANWAARGKQIVRKRVACVIGSHPRLPRFDGLPFLLPTDSSACNRYVCTTEAFSFLMTLAISMQLSVCVIFWLDDGVLVNAFIDSCESTAREICQSDNLELWQTALLMPERNLRDVCSCVDAGDGSSDGTNAFAYKGFADCLRRIADQEVRASASAGGSSAMTVAMVVMLLTMAVEAMLSYL